MPVLGAAGVSVAEEAVCWQTNCLTTMVVMILPLHCPLVVVAEVALYLRGLAAVGSGLHDGQVRLAPEWTHR